MAERTRMLQNPSKMVMSKISSEWQEPNKKPGYSCCRLRMHAGDDVFLQWSYAERMRIPVFFAKRCEKKLTECRWKKLGWVNWAAELGLASNFLSIRSLMPDILYAQFSQAKLRAQMAWTWPWSPKCHGVRGNAKTHAASFLLSNVDYIVDVKFAGPIPFSWSLSDPFSACYSLFCFVIFRAVHSKIFCSANSFRAVLTPYSSEKICRSFRELSWASCRSAIRADGLPLASSKDFLKIAFLVNNSWSNQPILTIWVSIECSFPALMINASAVRKFL